MVILWSITSQLSICSCPILREERGGDVGKEEGGEGEGEEESNFDESLNFDKSLDKELLSPDQITPDQSAQISHKKVFQT